MLLLGKFYSFPSYHLLESNGKGQMREKMETYYVPTQREDRKEKAMSK